MPNFNKHLDIRYLDGDNYLLLSDFDFYYFQDTRTGEMIEDINTIDVNEQEHFIKCWIRVPKGFITDFASVPRILHSVLPKTGKYGKAAVLHDYLYRTALQNVRLFSRLRVITKLYTREDEELHFKNCKWEPITQREADRIFKFAMSVLEVNSVRKFLLYQGVNLFGHYTFDVYTKSNLGIPEFKKGDIVTPIDFRIGESLPVRLEVEYVRRNLIAFLGVRGEYLTYNFKYLRGRK